MEPTDPNLADRVYFRTLIEDALPVLAEQHGWPVRQPLEFLHGILAACGAKLPAEPVFTNLPARDLRKAIAMTERVLQSGQWPPPSTSAD